MTAADDRLKRAADVIANPAWLTPTQVAAAVLAAFADDLNELDRLRQMALGDGVTVIDSKRDDELDRLRAENAALRKAADAVDAWQGLLEGHAALENEVDRLRAEMYQATVELIRRADEIAALRTAGNEVAGLYRAFATNGGDTLALETWRAVAN